MILSATKTAMAAQAEANNRIALSRTSADQANHATVFATTTRDRTIVKPNNLHGATARQGRRRSPVPPSTRTNHRRDDTARRNENCRWKRGAIYCRVRAALIDYAAHLPHIGQTPAVLILDMDHCFFVRKIAAGAHASCAVPCLPHAAARPDQIGFAVDDRVTFGNKTATHARAGRLRPRCNTQREQANPCLRNFILRCAIAFQQIHFRLLAMCFSN